MAQPTALGEAITVDHSRSSRRRLVMGGLAGVGGLGLGLARPGRAHAAQSLSSPVTIDVATGAQGLLSFLRGGDTKWTLAHQPTSDELWVWDDDAVAPAAKFTPGGSGSGVSHVLLAPLGGKVGIATWSGAPTALLELGKAGTGTTALTDRVVSDVAHGDHQQSNGVGSAGSRWNIQHGTAGSPVTDQAPTFKVSRLEDRAGEDFQSGGAFYDFAAISAMNNGTATTTAMAVALSGAASSRSTAWPTGNADCAGVFGRGLTLGSGNGVAHGGSFEASTHSTSGIAKGIEVLARNQANPPIAGGGFNPAGLSRITGIWIALNEGDGGAGITFGNPGNQKWTAGINFTSQNTGPINTTTGASIRDDGNGATSLQINGNHTYAITVGATAGAVVIGAPGGVGGGSKATIRTTDPAESALKLQAAASQSVDTLVVFDSTPTPIFGIGSSGSVRMYDGKNLIMGAGGTGVRIGTAPTQKIGFWNATPTAQPTVSGSRGGNAALASLLTQLAAMGLVVDSTTA